MNSVALGVFGESMDANAADLSLLFSRFGIFAFYYQISGLGIYCL